MSLDESRCTGEIVTCFPTARLPSTDVEFCFDCAEAVIYALIRASGLAYSTTLFVEFFSAPLSLVYSVNCFLVLIFSTPSVYLRPVVATIGL